MTVTAGPRMTPFGRHLSAILLSDPRCRRKWSRHGIRRSPAELHQAAVATVLAQWLWESGEVDVIDDDLPRRLKDTVSRALTAERVSPRTLRLFVEAFDLTEEQQDELWGAC